MPNYSISVYYGIEITDPKIDYRRYGLNSYDSGYGMVVIGNCVETFTSSAKGFFEFDEKTYLEHHKTFIKIIKRKLNRAGIPVVNPTFYFRIGERSENF